jgi:FkbM family methyltransferase
MTKLAELARTVLSVSAYVLRHPANRGHRLRAMKRAIAFQLRARVAGKNTLAPIGQRMLLEVPLHAHGASKAVYANPPDWPEMNLWRSLLKAGDLFIDVGSNLGLYAVWAADCGAHPLAVEPDPANAERTRANLRRNRIPSKVVESALGATRGTMRFTTDADAENHLVVHGGGSTTREVSVTTIDALLGGRSARGVKIDVEGAERLVLNGAAASLGASRIDVLQIEWNPLSQSLLGETRLPVADLLRAHGYVLCEPDPAGHRLVPLDPPAARVADVFAVSPRAAGDLGLI